MSIGLLTDVNHLWYDQYGLQDVELSFFSGISDEHSDTGVDNPSGTSSSQAVKSTCQKQHVTKVNEQIVKGEAGAKQKPQQKSPEHLTGNDNANSNSKTSLSISDEIAKLREQIQAALLSDAPRQAAAHVVHNDEATQLRALVADMQKHMKDLEKRIAQLEA